MERGAWLVPELRNRASINAQKSVGIRSLCYFGITEDIHKQCVRAVGAIELFPLPIGPRSCALVGRVDFIEASRPFPVVADHSICGGVKVPMPPFLIAAEDDAGDLPIGEFVEIFMNGRKPHVPETELTPQA